MAGAHPKAAIVTGASRGIGRAVALELAREGFAVVVNYLSNREAAESVVAEVTASGGTAVAVQADVGRHADRVALVNAAETHFGRLDLLVNNAGITSQGRKDLLEATEESWDRVLDTNLKGPFFLAQAAALAMLRGLRAGTVRQGVLINVSSISAYAVSTNRADYCIAKAGMAMLTQLFATRLAEERILVYEVCPGVIASDMTAPVREKYERLIAEGLSPIRRWGEPEDVARAVAVLARGDLNFTTGDRINVDGGFHIRRL